MSNLKNHLKDATSPYLLQHADNPVDWYPWCEEAFSKARREDKPVFLSIGYSTCHWCHVMAHESFEDPHIAEILNLHFVSIKVDKEERPDIDSIYMSFCQAFSGSGGWPTSIFMTWDQKPFFAGTYFPKVTQLGAPGFEELLLAILKQWDENREGLLSASDEITRHLKSIQEQPSYMEKTLIEKAILQFSQHFDERYGGFGGAPKFPTPHHLLFLMEDYLLTRDKHVLNMVETTLLQMYKGGLFDHIGFGFARYSTDRFFLVPHFEKMLYDNALLILAYAKAFSITKKPVFLDIAEKTAAYVLREMTHPGGGFYSAQDADSDGVEGKYYVFDYTEILSVLGEEDGKRFCDHYGITPQGNFEGSSIPNLLSHDAPEELESYLPKLYAYRKKRAALHLDDKILTAWNGMMITALSYLYRVSGREQYLTSAQRADAFLSKNLSDDQHLFVSFRDQRHTGKGFLDDYAYYAWALLSLYEATLKPVYLERAIALCDRAICDFYDEEHGGFFLYGKHNEQLILTPKETYDGAVPSGNAVMAYLFVRLSNITGKALWRDRAETQLRFLSGHAKEYPMGYSFFLSALLLFWNPPDHVVIVTKDPCDLDTVRIPLHMDALVLLKPTEEYPLLHDKTTYYVCKNHACRPASNRFSEECL